MFLGPHLTCIAANAGCVDIFGTRSRAPSVLDAVAFVAGREGLKVAEDGNMVGRRGPRKDVNVLGKVLVVIACLKI